MGDDSGSEDGEKAAGLLRVVWFRQMLHRWQSSSTATARRSSDGDAGADDRQSNGDTTTPAASADDDNDRKPLLPADSADRRRRLPRVVVVEERRLPDAEGGNNPGSSPMTPEPPADVPRGSCAVYVGAERRRFVVPTAYLGMPVFRRLLEKAEEEFEFDFHGAGLTIPCDTEAFKYILVVMERHQQGLVDDEGNPKDREPAEPSETR